MNKIAAISIFCIGIALPLVFFAGYVYPTIRRLEAENERLINHVDMHAKRSVFPATAAKRAEAELPTKYAAPYPVPRYYQEDRGTCWDFALIGILEQSYRANGIKKGYLKKNEYVRFNEQAFGLSTITACKKHPDVCDVIGDSVYLNATNGGEVYWLWNLRELYSQLLPASVCPYTDKEHQYECPGMEAALAKNPIKFDVKSMLTKYNGYETKQVMVEKTAPLAWSVAIHAPLYYFSCGEAYWAAREECSTAKRVRCPADGHYYNSEWCAEVTSTMFNPDGEFFVTGRTMPKGGHAMNVVGYNDEFTTKNGHTGGFIIKNSWHDQNYGTETAGRGARGSHSIKYWMQEISAWDEKALCPLPHNPENWISCAELAAGPHSTGGKNKNSRRKAANGEYDIAETCLSKAFMDHLVNVTMQPAEFVCLDEAVCSKDPRYRYFFLSLERTAERDLARAEMLQYDTVTKAQKTITTPLHIPAHIGYFFEPVKAQLEKLKSDEDECGYWFWPYDTLHRQQGVLQNFFSSYFDIEWADSSYLANKAKYPGYDYSWIEKSTKTMQDHVFLTPNPRANNRY